MKQLIQLGVVVAVCACLSGCGGNSDKSLVGKWEFDSYSEDGGKSFSYTRSAPRNFPDKMELFKNGTGICDNLTISWKTENKRLIILSSSSGGTFDYKFMNYVMKGREDKIETRLLLTADNLCVGYEKK